MGNLAGMSKRKDRPIGDTLWHPIQLAKLIWRQRKEQQ